MKLFVWVAAVVMILLGLATVWTPLPTGVPLIAGGLILILGSSRQATRWLRARRRRLLRLDEAFIWVEEKAPKGLTAALRRTRPRRKAPSPPAPTPVPRP